MKTLDRYVLRELMVPFLIGTLAVVLMFEANLLIAQLKEFQLQAVPLQAILQILLYKAPMFLSMTLFVGISLAASLAISRITRETELTAIRSAGASIMRVVRPVMVFGLLVGVGNFILAERIVPPAERKVKQLLSQALIVGGIPEFKSNVVVNLRNYTASIGLVQRKKIQGQDVIELQNVLLFERPRADEIWFYKADTGEYRNGVWSFPNGHAWTFKGNDLLKFEAQKVVFTEQIVITDIFVAPAPEDQTAEQLQQSIRENRRFGRDTTMLEVALHARYSVPAACLVFSVVAPVFAVLFARGGGFVGILLSIFLVFLYYNAYVISTEIMGRNNWVSPWMAAWLPNILFAMLGLLGLRRLE